MTKLAIEKAIPGKRSRRSSRSKPRSSSKFNVQEFKVILRPGPTVPVVPGGRALASDLRRLLA
jgi:hypothetical protein